MKPGYSHLRTFRVILSSLENEGKIVLFIRNVKQRVSGSAGSTQNVMNKVNMEMCNGILTDKAEFVAECVSLLPCYLKEQVKRHIPDTQFSCFLHVFYVGEHIA